MEGDAFPAKGKSRRAFVGRRLEVGWRPRSHFGLVNVDIPAKSTHYFRKAASSLDLRRELAARAWPRGVGAGEQGPGGDRVGEVSSRSLPRAARLGLVTPDSSLLDRAIPLQKYYTLKKFLLRLPVSPHYLQILQATF